MKRRRINWQHLYTVILLTCLLIVNCISTAMLLSVKSPEYKELPTQEQPLARMFVKKQFDLDCFEKAVKEKEAELASLYLGEFKLTAYCPCSLCCGIYSDGITASGTYAKANRTIAVDPRIIPLGTKVNINGISYIAEDTGSAIKGNKIDIFVENHSDCFQSHLNGYAEVYLEA